MISDEFTNFQRKGAISNTHVGREFQEAAQLFFKQTGVLLHPEFAAFVGGKMKKPHKFDLGSDDPPILVECKSYTWTSGGNSPSAKIRSLNEAMLLFSVAPRPVSKDFFYVKASPTRFVFGVALHKDTGTSNRRRYRDLEIRHQTETCTTTSLIALKTATRNPHHD
jgi:hypothetical protein